MDVEYAVSQFYSFQMLPSSLVRWPWSAVVSLCQGLSSLLGGWRLERITNCVSVNASMWLLTWDWELPIWEVARLQIHTYSLEFVSSDLGLLFWNCYLVSLCLEPSCVPQLSADWQTGGLSLFQPSFFWLWRVAAPWAPAEGISGDATWLIFDDRSLMTDQTLQTGKSESHVHVVLPRLDTSWISFLQSPNLTLLSSFGPRLKLI